MILKVEINQCFLLGVPKVDKAGGGEGGTDPSN